MSDELTVREQNDEAFEEMVDALDHIARVCRGSRTDTRRLRWIEARARCAIEGGRDWRELNIPKLDPRVARAEGLIDSVVDVVERYAETLRSSYEEGPGGPISDLDVLDDLDVLETFITEAKRLPNVRRRRRAAAGLDNG